VTDAHVVLGRISAEQFLGGEMRIDPSRSEAAIARAGSGKTDAIAAGIIRVVNSNMEHAIRVVSVERGEDPRGLPLVAFGGGGGLHACELAEALSISTVLVPRDAGVLSALGMLLSDQKRDYSRGALGARDIEQRFAELEARAGADLPGAKLERMADLRYRGQSYELTVPWDPRDPDPAFHAAHSQIYGYADPKREAEVVTIRVQATLAVEKPSLTMEQQRAASGVASERRVFTGGKWRTIPVLSRTVVESHAATGPALILDYGATTVVPPGWSYRVDAIGNLVLLRVH
jgi:N-methylhydantoinase A